MLSLVVVFYFADFRKLGAALSQADFGFVTIALFFTLVWLVVRGKVWRTLLQEKASLRDVFLTLNEGYLLNNILPFRLGEVGRAFLLGRKAGLDFWSVLSSILIERVLDLALAAGLLLTTLPFVIGASWARQAAMVVGGMVLVTFAVLYLLARNQDWAMSWFDKLSARWSLLLKLGGKAVPAFIKGLAVLTDGSRFLRAVGWITLNWMIGVGQYYLLLVAFFPEPEFLWAAFSLGVAALGIAIPSSPGAVGVLEVSIVGSLSLFGLDPTMALAFAITLHLIQYLVTGVLGTYALAKDGESLIELYERVRRIQS